MQRIAITGADGFIGRIVTRKLREAGFGGELRLFDRAFAAIPADRAVAIDLSSPEAAGVVAEGADCIIHLAAMPGQSAERNAIGSRAINLDFPLDLLEVVKGRRLVLASSIAVFGGKLPALVDDDTIPVPQSVYGTHKRMVELAFVDAVRRGEITGCCLRLPGIVARPRQAAGFGSAFLSEIFHAARSSENYRIPVGPDAVSWLLSARLCAENIVHAALGRFTCGQTFNLPCEAVCMSDLITAIADEGFDTKFTFVEDPDLRAIFGSYTAIRANRAQELGFKSDGSLTALVANTFAEMNQSS